MERAPVPEDINQHREVIAPPSAPLNARIALYVGFGSGEYGIDNVRANLIHSAGITPSAITAEDIETNGLTDYSVVIFPGGMGKDEGDALGKINRERVLAYVENGGRYLGICAGAYLALSGRDWSLGLINGMTVEGEWHRGHGYPDVEISKEGEEVFGKIDGTFKCRYANGPIFEPLELAHLPPYIPLAYFRSEVSEQGNLSGMNGSPAAAWAPYGKGKACIISSHPENTPGLEYFVPRVLEWLMK